MRTLNSEAARTITPVRLLAGLAIVVLGCAPMAHGQTQNTDSREQVSRPAEQVKTFYLANATGERDLDNAQTALRNVLSRARIYGIWEQNAIVVRGTPEELDSAKTLLADLDKPRKSYRVTYTITSFDGEKRLDSQHYSLIVAGNDRATLKCGTRVPIVTGTIDKDTSAPDTQVQYVDVGLHIEATISGSSLRSKVEQSSVAEEKSNVGIQDPIVRQTTLDTQTAIAPGKPAILGSLDLPGTTRRQEIEARAEPVQ